MRQSILSDRILSLYFPAGLFIVVGLSITALLLLLGGLSWVVLCFFSLVLLGILWMYRPALAAVLSVGPLLGIASSVTVPRAGPGEAYHLLGAVFFTIWVVVPFAGLIAAVFFLLTALRDWPRWRLPLVLSFTFVAASFLANRLFVDVDTVRTYKMHFTLDGKQLNLQMPQGAVAVYRSIDNGYCFDEVNSQKLRDRLASRPDDEVVVQYEITRDFGRVRGYNVLTVDGIDVRNENGRGGSGSAGSGTSPECF